MYDFEFYSEEHVDKLQTYIEENYRLEDCSKILVKNILNYAAEQSEDDESALLILEMLLEGIGLTRSEIVCAVVTEHKELEDKGCLSCNNYSRCNICSYCIDGSEYERRKW